MKQFIIFIFSISLIACNEVSNPTLIENDSDSISNIETNTITELDTVITETVIERLENESPDGSWKVDLNYCEGYLQDYTVILENGDSITIKYNDTLPIIGAMDYTRTEWLDSNIYKVPNIGATANGYYEMLIYKDGTCKYIEHKIE
jgi:hypothetical protein